MKVKKQFILVIGVFILFIASNVQATDFHSNFAMEGYGSFMDANPTWSGDLMGTGGGLTPGTFWIKVDASGWPSDNPGTPENERWDYIFSNYFTYDDTEGAECWDAFFPNTDLGDNWLEWRFNMDNGDIVGGTSASFVITVQDLNDNGIMEDSEYRNKVFAGVMIAWINFGAGTFEGFCGNGGFSGELNVTDEVTMEEKLYVPTPYWGTGNLNLTDLGCSTPTENVTWGAIKALCK